jgi:hypothetical protein
MVLETISSGRFAARARQSSLRSLAVALALVGVTHLPVAGTSAALAQCNYTFGAVIQLVGTPHLFITDDHGILHWGGRHARSGEPTD